MECVLLSLLLPITITLARVLIRVTSAFSFLSKMDDCSLEKLSIKPGKLSPIFKRDTTEYSVTLGSNVAQITIDCFASDSGASYTISVM